MKLRNSLYLLIPIELTKALNVTKETEFYLNIKYNENTALVYSKIENKKPLEEDEPKKQPAIRFTVFRQRS